MPACKHVPSDQPLAQTAEADLAELEAALGNLPAVKRAGIVQEYRQLRKELQDRAAKRQDRIERKELSASSAADSSAVAEKRAPELALPNGLPREFELYVHGAIAWSDGRRDRAVDCWQQVLCLPAESRKYRSTWSAFMLGRALLDTKPDRAREYFSLTRKLANEGFADRIGLAAASLGWEAKLELDSKNYEQALELYLQQAASGDSQAYNSMRYVVNKIMDSDAKTLERLARDFVSRRVITAFIISNGGPVQARCEALGEHTFAKAWLLAVRHVGVPQVENADRIAWLAYQAGDYQAAKDWLGNADADSAIALWISAKLDLRSGRVEQAAANLARVARAFPSNEEWQNTGDSNIGIVEGDGSFSPEKQVLGELAAIKLSRGQYEESLDILLKAGWWMDAAYVAERVLTADELIAYVNKHPPDSDSEPAELADLSRRYETSEQRYKEGLAAIRYLLARRLTRVGRWKEARQHFTSEQQSTLDHYISGIRRGADKSLTASERAEALWASAQIARNSGLELMGTELAPDYYIWSGNYAPLGEDNDPVREADGKLLPLGKEESRRHQQSAPPVVKRFHYRYIAADHAWAAAALMPDQSDQTADVLWQAGRWLTLKDPAAADRFYKALVNRCGKTALGKEADSLRWFPKAKPAQ